MKSASPLLADPIRRPPVAAPSLRARRPATGLTADKVCLLLLCVYAFLLPLEPVLPLDVLFGQESGATLTKAYSMIVAAVIISCKPNFLAYVPWTAFAMLGWLAWGTISSWMNRAPLINAVVLNGLFVLVIPCCVRNRRQVEHVWLAYAMGGILACVVTLAAPEYTDFGRRMIGLGGSNPNDFTLTCSITLLLVLYFNTGHSVVRPNPVIRMAGWLAVAPLTWSVAFTGSRSGWAAMAAVAVTTLWLRDPKNRRGTALRWAVSGALAAMMYLVLTSTHLAGRFESGMRGDSSNRDKIWKIAWTAYDQCNKVIGVGLRRSDRLLPDYATQRHLAQKPRLDVHNTYFTVLIETGIVGLGMYLIGLLTPFSALLCLPRRIRGEAVAAAGTLVVCLVASISGTYYIYKDHWMLWVLAAVTYHLVSIGRWQISEPSRVRAR